MKIKSFLTSVFLLAITYSFGQVNLLNAEHPDEIGVKTEMQVDQDNTAKPLPYGYIGDRDIMWGKEVWEYIDLSQKVNFPLLYPIDTGRVGSERLSLYQVLMKNIENGKIKHMYADSYFQRERTMEELAATLHRVDTLDAGYEQINQGEQLDEQFISHTDVDGSDITGYRIRGYWYVDKRQGELRYRLLGICPLVVDAYSKQQGVENPTPVELFWIFYPEARNVLYRAQVFNNNNSAHPFNFDEILNGRRFHAVIYKVDNDQGDRDVADYIHQNSLKQLLESERLKDEIREFESNLWNY